MSDAAKIQKIEKVIARAEEWSNDKYIPLTDGQIATASLRNIRRILNATVVKDPDWESVKEKIKDIPYGE